MNIIQRAQDILLKPKATWPQIAAEPASVASIFQQWLLILAAIPALASFIGLSLLGVGGFGFRLPIASGLVQMVMSYLLALGMVYVMALVVDALAPTFGGRKNFLAAFKLVAYSCTAAFVGGIFNLIPSLAVLGLLAAIYSIYLLYLGLPVLMGQSGRQVACLHRRCGGGRHRRQLGDRCAQCCAEPGHGHGHGHDGPLGWRR
jgi:hypothetical protein